MQWLARKTLPGEFLLTGLLHWVFVLMVLASEANGRTIVVVTPEREKRQAAVDSIDALIGTERFS
jgi:hypothetical protein